MVTRKKTKYIHEGKYVAEVDVDLVIDDDEWSPYLTIEDAYKLDDVRVALRKGNLKTAAKKAKVYLITHKFPPISEVCLA